MEKSESINLNVKVTQESISQMREKLKELDVTLEKANSLLTELAFSELVFDVEG